MNTEAPFTTEQVLALSLYQNSLMHPLTCGNTDHHSNGQRTELIPTHEGLICPDPRCTIIQTAVPAALTDLDHIRDMAKEQLLMWQRITGNTP